MNIDDLLYEHNVSSKLIEEINGYVSRHNISISNIVKTINSNNDITGRNYYNDIPLNIWYSPDNNIDNATIKLSVPSSYIEDLLSGKITTIHRVIAEVILYALYKCGNEKNPRGVANNVLNLYRIVPQRSIIELSSKNANNIYNGLEPDTSYALKNVINNLHLITAATDEYGSKRIKQLYYNLSQDLGFCFAYMTLNLVDIGKKDKEKKKNFLNELKLLIDKYSKDDPGIDLYE